MIHYLDITKTARIEIEGFSNPKLKHVWLVAHGYGHLITFFKKKFNTLFSEEHLVLIPEALHRFYINGHSGKVGASWMTKEEREHDIKDYCNYLDDVYRFYISELNTSICVNALGFSQGGATICRWAASTNFHIDNLIVWGSVIPPDMNWIEDEEKLKKINWHYVSGSEDEFLNKEQRDSQLFILEEHGIHPELIIYEGGHDLNDATLGLLTQKCVKKT